MTAAETFMSRTVGYTL